jgi:nicotinamidase-related amidase
MQDLELLAASTGLVVIDFQERLAAAMPKESLARIEKNVGILLAAAVELSLPVVVTEQYPKGLGPTVAAVEAKLAAVSPGKLVRAEKVEFNAACAAPVAAALAEHGARSWVLCGMECHVCVYMTAREIVRRGYATHVVEDAVASRTEGNRAAGLRLIERAGAVLTTTETVVFDLLGKAGTSAFKALSPLLR